jgi:prevent-host-death family protein
VTILVTFARAADASAARTAPSARRGPENRRTRYGGPDEAAMKRVPISRLKARLSEYLEAVKAGEEVIVTDRGRPVARIAPVPGSEERGSRVRMLVRTGQARPPDVEGGIDVKKIATRRPRGTGVSLVDAVIEERRESP